MQKFSYNLLKESKFQGGGLRDYFLDRDLGVTEATAGLAMAQVHKACAPCPEGGSGAHYHKLDFQFNYVLKGWMEVDFTSEGQIRFEAGDSWVQPPEIHHNVIGFSEDLEVLEITMPGTFDTVEV